MNRFAQFLIFTEGCPITIVPKINNYPALNSESDRKGHGDQYIFGVSANTFDNIFVFTPLSLGCGSVHHSSVSARANKE